MPADLKPSIDPADLDRGLNAASCLISAAMDLIRRDDKEQQFPIVDTEAVWHVLFAADARLCKIREALEPVEEEA